MITGGLGFIGSNLARQLVELGADVLLVDSLIPDYGGNLFNIDGIDDRVRVNIADVRQQTHDELPGARPRGDLQPRRPGQPHRQHARSVHRSRDQLPRQLSMLEACRNHNPAVKVVFAGTRQVYGRPDSLPVDETHLVRPTDVNGINKAAGEYYHLRLQQRVRRPRLLAAADQRLRPAPADQAQPPGLHRLVHPPGDRGQRDPDLRRRLAAARLRLRGRCRRRVPARGRERRVQRRGVQRRRRRADQPSRPGGAADRRRRHRAACAYVEWPPEKKAIDIGSFYADSTQVPQTRPAGRRRSACAKGLRRTVAFYRAAPRRTTSTRRRAAAVSAARDPVPAADARRGRRRRATRRSTASSSAAGSCSGPEVEAFETEFAAACRRGARGRRRHRHRRARADPARARHRRRATK